MCWLEQFGRVEHFSFSQVFYESIIYVAQAYICSFIFLTTLFSSYKWGTETGQGEFIKSIAVKQLDYRPDPFITVLHEWLGVWVHAREEERVVSGLTNDDWRQGLNLWRQQSYRKRSLARKQTVVFRTALVSHTRRNCSRLFPFTECILLRACYEFSVDSTLHVCHTSLHTSTGTSN